MSIFIEENVFETVVKTMAAIFLSLSVLRTVPGVALL